MPVKESLPASCGAPGQLRSGVAMPPPETVAERLRQAFKATGKTQGEIARAAPIDPKHLRRLLKGEVGLGRRKAEDLARAFGVSSAWLLGLVEGTPVVEPRPYEVSAAMARLAQELEQMTPEGRAMAIYVGRLISQSGGLKGIGRAAKDALDRMDVDTAQPEDTGHTSQPKAKRARASSR